MPLHAYYLFIFSEIFTTKGSLKDLHIEGIKSWPPPIQDLVYHPSNFWNFLSLYCLVQVICHHNQCSESCNLGYSLVVNPICPRQSKIFNLFDFHFGHFSVFPVTSSTPVGALHSTPPKMPLK